MIRPAPRTDAVIDLSLATTAVLTLAAGATYLLDSRVLAPAGLQFLRIAATVLVVALIIVPGMQALRHLAPGLHGRLAPQLSLITVNCTLLGAVLLVGDGAGSLAGALALGLGSGLGFGVVLLLLAGLAGRLSQPAIPGPLRGPGIALLTLGMLALAVLGLSGIAGR